MSRPRTNSYLREMDDLNALRESKTLDAVARAIFEQRTEKAVAEIRMLADPVREHTPVGISARFPVLAFANPAVPSHKSIRIRMDSSVPDQDTARRSASVKAEHAPGFLSSSTNNRALGYKRKFLPASNSESLHKSSRTETAVSALDRRAREAEDRCTWAGDSQSRTKLSKRW